MIESRMAGRPYNVLVLGGGSAGCTLAARLSEDPERSVCLVEAGPDYGHYDEGSWPADILDARWLALDSHRWERDDEDDRSQVRAKVLGGCSAHNACVLLEGAPSDYDWGAGWSHEELKPSLERARTQPGPARSRRTRSRPGMAPFGSPAARRRSSTRSTPSATCAGTRASRTSIPRRAGPNLTILADTLVDGVLLGDRRAVGARTSRGELRAEVVVVSASAYGSPGVPGRGIGPADELTRHGIDLQAELPVGEGLTDHVGAGAAWEPTERLLEETEAHEAEHGLYMGQVTNRMRSHVSPPGLHDIYLSRPGRRAGDECRRLPDEAGLPRLGCGSTPASRTRRSKSTTASSATSTTSRC